MSAAKESMVDSLVRQIRMDPAHRGKLEKISGYVEKHRIQELFNEILVNILTERPKNVQEFIGEQLKSVVKQDVGDGQSIWKFPKQLLGAEDFEAIFQTYDVLKLNHVPIDYLIDALTACGVPEAQTLVETKYKDNYEEGHVNKVTFLYILEEEHRRYGFSAGAGDN
jgi:hypothetical protein